MRTPFLTSILATVVIASALGSNADDSLNKGMVRRHHSKMAARDAEETTHALQKRSFQGKATYYYIGPGARGACGNVLNNNDYTVALNEVQYGNLGVRSSYCGQTITITNGVKTTQARIEDACPTGVNCHYGALDLSTSLFEFFNDKSVGIFDITWWMGGGSGGGGSSSSSKNNDKATSSSGSGSSSSSSSSSDAAKASAKAERIAAKEKAAADKAAKEEAAAKKKAAREKAKKEKAAAEKKAKQEAKILAAQKSSLNQFSEIMQTLNQIVADSLDSSSSSSSDDSSSATATAASSTASA